MIRLAEALDHFKQGLGDVAMVLAFTGLRWEEAVAVPAENVDLDNQCMTIDGPRANRVAAVICART